MIPHGAASDSPFRKGIALRVLVAAGDRLPFDDTAVTLERNGMTVMRAVDAAAAGADDFVAKPFGSAQLAWRIRAVHGRYTSVPSAARLQPSLLYVGSFADWEKGDAERQGNPLVQEGQS